MEKLMVFLAFLGVFGFGSVFFALLGYISPAFGPLWWQGLRPPSSDLGSLALWDTIRQLQLWVSVLLGMLLSAIAFGFFAVLRALEKQGSKREKS